MKASIRLYIVVPQALFCYTRYSTTSTATLTLHYTTVLVYYCNLALQSTLVSFNLFFNLIGSQNCKLHKQTAVRTWLLTYNKDIVLYFLERSTHTPIKTTCDRCLSWGWWSVPSSRRWDCDVWAMTLSYSHWCECMLVGAILLYLLRSWITIVADVLFLPECLTCSLHNCNFRAGGNKTLVDSCTFLSLVFLFIQLLALPAILIRLLWVSLPQIIVNLILITRARHLWWQEGGGLLSAVFNVAWRRCPGTTVCTAGSASITWLRLPVYG